MLTALIVILVVIAIFKLAPRPKLDATPRTTQVPNIDLTQLPDWLESQEGRVSRLIAGNAAHIEWADPDQPQQTDLSFLYLHGFSATWQETAPLTSRLATTRGANVVHGRLAGHGEGSDGMLTPAERWLQSVTDHFDIASRVGKKVVVVATSTGCTLTTYLVNQPALREKIHACIFLSPNFRIRSPFGFLLTWPFSNKWVHLILGREHKWDPISEQQAKAWTHQYSTLALIEMQKTVDYAARLDYGSFKTPLAVMYMQNDTTIYPPAAIDVFNRWGARSKTLIRVEPNGEAAEHVFVGDIVAPDRLEWCLARLNQFLDDLARD
jgi:esterase/lipase